MIKPDEKSVKPSKTVEKTTKKSAVVETKAVNLPEYRPVLFVDNSSGAEFVISSTVHTTETRKAKDGKEYPMYGLDISSASHPFYTGKEKILDTAGRVEKFKARVAKAKVGKK